MWEEIKSGAKLQKNVEISGTEVSVPVTFINGAVEGKSVVITSDVYSGEYPGIECAIELAQVIRKGPCQIVFVT